MIGSVRGGTAVCLVAAWAFVVCVLPLSFFGKLPSPIIHDEFSYLLAADTFAHGRLTNPPHPMWQHFETFHVIQQPTYASKFPPAQGLALALGQVLWHPILGVWLSVAAACAAVTWMLLGFVPSRWALLGGLITAIHPVVHWWSQCYWGGAVAMLGGALLGGAAIRLANRPAFSCGLVTGAGLAILANSRPFEGLIYSAVVGGLTVMSAWRTGVIRPLVVRGAVGALAVFLPTAAWMMYYNWRVTGEPLLMPYMLHARQYMMAPLMFWQKPRPAPQYHHEIMQRFYTGNEWAEYERLTTPAGFIHGTGEKLLTNLRGFARPPTVLVPITVALMTLRRCSAVQWATFVCAGFPLIHVVCTPWFRTQYVAPAAGFFFLLIVLGMMQIARIRWPSRRSGGFLVIALLLWQLIAGIRWMIEFNTRDLPLHAVARPELIQWLISRPGRDLVIVRYPPSYLPLAEWVFNDADLQNAEVIFARSMGPEADEQLAKYFADRRIWTAEVGIDVHVRAYPTTGPATTPLTNFTGDSAR